MIANVFLEGLLPGPKRSSLGTRPWKSARVPSSRCTSRIVCMQLLYLEGALSSEYFWMRDLATSNGIFNIEAIEPAGFLHNQNKIITKYIIHKYIIKSQIYQWIRSRFCRNNQLLCSKDKTNASFRFLSDTLEKKKQIMRTCEPQFSVQMF